MTTYQDICAQLKNICLDACANFICNYDDEVDLNYFQNLLLGGPEYYIHIPLACIFHRTATNFHDGRRKEETKDLLDAIEVFRELRQMSEVETGLILDSILDYNQKIEIISSVTDLTCIFSLLQLPNSSWILDKLRVPSSDFWKSIFYEWIENYGGFYFPANAVNLFKSSDVGKIHNILDRMSPERIQIFFFELEEIQNFSFPLTPEDWREIILKVGENSGPTLLSASLGKVFSKWLAEDDSDSSLRLEILSVVNSLLQDTGWRFDDVQKLFRLNKNPENLKSLLETLKRVHHGELSFEAEDILPNAVNLSMEDDTSVLVENDEGEPRSDDAGENQFQPGSILTTDLLYSILMKNGLPTSAKFIRDHSAEIDLNRYQNFLCGPNPWVHIPLACIIHNLEIAQNDMTRLEMDQLLKAINEVQENNTLEKTVEKVLEHILACHVNNQIIVSVTDLTSIFWMLHLPNSSWILDRLNCPRITQTTFWSDIFNLWLEDFNMSPISTKLVDLLKTANVWGLHKSFVQASPKDVIMFFIDLEKVQESSYKLQGKDWQTIIGNYSGGIRHALKVLHSAVLGKCVLNWLTSNKSQSDIISKVVSVVMELVQDRSWRFSDVQTLFRYSKKKEHLYKLLTVLKLIHERDLSSKVLDGSITKVDEIKKSFKELLPPVRTSKESAVRITVNSDFIKYTHSESPITEESVTKMMTEFDKEYRGEKGRVVQFAKEVKAVKAVENFFEVKLRDVQILGVLLARAARNANVSRLLQMQTGEGKTFVIAVLAITEVLCGNKVDIITSSETLAINQTDELKNLYASVKIKVCHNCINDKTPETRSAVYCADVVYGTASTFMDDLLHEEFYGTGIRNGRGFPLAIVDEVDAQMLDNANHICKMSSAAAGMGNLLGLQASIRRTVLESFRNMECTNGVWRQTNGTESVEIGNDDDLKKYLKNGLAEEVHHIAGFHEDSSDNQKIEFPQTLHDVCKEELPYWLESAIDSVLKKLDFDYCLEDGKVVIVDAAKSGSRNREMRWSYGLHQFLEMRHATRLSPENLIMCFLSTMSFFRRYNSNLIGLTGTIGGEASRKFLKKVYNVDFVEIPPFMERRHTILPHTMCLNTEEWIKTIIDKVVSKLDDGQACLVITEFIHFAKILSNEINSRTGKNAIMITGAEESSEYITELLKSGTCIVATNKAGRGTDLKLSDGVEAAGGLHVILTSLPMNDRVERQNLGRSSRGGQVGSSQMIINVEQVEKTLIAEMVERCGKGASHTLLLNTLREVRDDLWLRCVDDLVERVESIGKSDTALIEFIKLRNAFMESYKKSSFNKYRPEMLSHIESALNIRFGVYLTKNSSETLDPEKVRQEFEFLTKVCETGDILQCFTNYVHPVYAACNIEWDVAKKRSNFDSAQQFLSHAIDLDPKFAGAAYYMRAYSHLKLYNHSKNPEDITKAIEDFELCRSVVKTLLSQYQLLRVITKQPNEESTKLEAQSQRFMCICGCVISNIDALIGKNVEEELSSLNKLAETFRTRKEDASQIEDQIKELEKNREVLEKSFLKEISEKGTEV